MRNPFAGAVKRRQERKRQDMLEGGELRPLTGGSRPASIGRQSQILHQSQSLDSEAKFRDDFREYISNSDAELIGQKIQAWKNQGGFEMLASYYGYSQNSGKVALRLTEDLTWYACLKFFRDLLQRNTHSDFEFLAIFADSSVSFKETLTFWRKLWPSGPYLVENVARIMRHYVIREAALEWNLRPNHTLELSLLLGQQRAHRYTHEFPRIHKVSLWKAGLPSSSPEVGPELTTRDIFAFEYPTKKTIISFTSDLHVYVFRPFAGFPRMNQLNICLFHHQCKSTRKILLLAPNSHDLGQLPNAKTWHGQVIEVTLSAVRHMRDCYIALVEKTLRELYRLDVDGRKYPSASKLQHVVHLEDCRRSALLACHTNNVTVDRLLGYLRGNFDISMADEHREHLQDIANFAKDLDYFAVELNRLAKETERIRQTLKELLDLMQMRRTTGLTLLAGLFIPMSFVSSFFGMNINQLDGEVSTWTNQTFIDPTDLNKTIGSNITETATRGGNQSFDLNTFWAISIPLTLGFGVLPSVGGATIRWLIRFLTRYSYLWRIWLAHLSLTASTASSLWLPVALFSLGLYGIFVVSQLKLAAQENNWKAFCYWILMFILSVIVAFGRFATSRALGADAEEGLSSLWGLAGMGFWVLSMLMWWRKPEWHYWLNIKWKG